MAGYTNVDLLPLDGVDVVADLNRKPWPFEDSQFELILCNHYLEHVADIVLTMEELHRIGEPGALVVFRTPYFANYESFRDPTHRWHLTLDSLDYFVEGNGYPKYTDRRYRAVSKELTFPHPWRHPGYWAYRLHKKTYEKYVAHVFPGTWLHIRLAVVK